MGRGSLSLSTYWRLLKGNRNFRLLWSAQIISEIGDWLYAISIYSLLLELTGSAQAVAVAIVFQELPQCLAAPAAGVLNDRLSRRRIMIGADLMRAGIVLLMLLALSKAWLTLIYTLLFVETTMWAFFEPARSAVIPSISRGEELLAANTLSSSTWSVNLAVGSALGGVVAAVFGRPAVFILNAVSFLVSAALVHKLDFDEPHLASSPPWRLRDCTDFSPVLEGIRYVGRDARLLSTLLVKTGLGIMGAWWVVLPVLGERRFPVHVPGVDPERAGMLGMSVLLGARGIGSLLGPLVSGYWAGSSNRRMRVGILYGFLAGVAGYLVIGYAGAVWLAVAAVILAHAGGSTVWVFSTTLLQRQTDDRFRGRVFSSDYALMVMTMSLATYAAGSLIDRGVAPQTIATLSGFAGLVPVAAWASAQRLWKRSAAGSLPNNGDA
jgi:MFS family permease